MIKIRQDWHPGHRVGGATLSHYLLNIMINMMMIDDHNNDDDDDDQDRMGTWDTGWGNNIDDDYYDGDISDDMIT